MRLQATRFVEELGGFPPLAEEEGCANRARLLVGIARPLA